jgi:hypothetical protein
MVATRISTRAAVAMVTGSVALTPKSNLERARRPARVLGSLLPFGLRSLWSCFPSAVKLQTRYQPRYRPLDERIAVL